MQRVCSWGYGNKTKTTLSPFNPRGDIVAYMQEFGADIYARALIKRILDSLACDIKVVCIYSSRASETLIGFWLKSWRRLGGGKLGH
ncbi:hypothetical protein [Candidatus Liberibacter sp.]|uniref:hypothetical protein n=1 Tax=Candidatus Liberibacter sp. TaxID=34022 RepID=UPI0015F7078B|nr:hypothetical protein [Candidatus Liberibacter sp.]MBA5723894.1 hypothetical protein [Candidatus Liberibacter sp.]